MRSRRRDRGSAIVMAVVVVLVVTVLGISVIRLASREVSGSIAVRNEAAISSCVEAGRSLLMSEWKLLGVHGVSVRPLDVVLDPGSGARVQGGHYGDNAADSSHWGSTSGTWVNNIQVIRLDPMSLGSAYQVSEMSNRIGDSIQAYRVVVHCTTNDGRQSEIEFGVQYGL